MYLAEFLKYVNVSEHISNYNQRYITIGIGNGVDSIDFIETFRVIVFHVH